MAEKPQPAVIGWREWLALPDLGLPAIKAKIDTGARTSVLHAFYVEPFKKDRVEHVRFRIRPLQKRRDIEVVCEAPIKDQRWVTDSGGHRELRYVIEVPVHLGGRVWPVEISLTDRDSMMFRMLLGRTAIKGHMMVDPARSYVTGKLTGRMSRKAYGPRPKTTKKKTTTKKKAKTT